MSGGGAINSLVNAINTFITPAETFRIFAHCFA